MAPYRRIAMLDQDPSQECGQIESQSRLARKILNDVRLKTAPIGFLQRLVSILGVEGGVPR
jgi:hypothetical protein